MLRSREVISQLCVLPVAPISKLEPDLSAAVLRSGQHDSSCTATAGAETCLGASRCLYGGRQRQSGAARLGCGGRQPWDRLGARHSGARSQAEPLLSLLHASLWCRCQ